MSKLELLKEMYDYIYKCGCCKSSIVLRDVDNLENVVNECLSLGLIKNVEVYNNIRFIFSSNSLTKKGVDFLNAEVF